MTKLSQIPAEALKNHIAILGMNGSGKTSVAKSQIMEPVLAAGERVCNIDPTGVGWGLRLRADGAPGFAIYIVGGDRADFALQRRTGKAWGEIVGTSSDSFVFDTSQMTVEDRSQWFTDFAETLLRKNRGPLHLVLDEAHLFAPQGGAKSGGVAPRMLHATNNLLALGRSRGLRVTMISQRAAKLHKDSLTQAHALVAMMMTSPQDRDAVKAWIADQADTETGKEIIASLPTLAPGEGWLWAPRLKVLGRVRFARPTTFDSSRAPDSADGTGPRLAPIDPAKIEGMLAGIAKEAVANDPATLRAENAALRKQLAAQRPIVDPGHDKKVYDRGFAAGLDAARGVIERHMADVAAYIGTTHAAIHDAFAMLVSSYSPDLASAPAPAPTAAAPGRRAHFPDVGKKGNGGLPGPEQRIIDAIAWWNAFGLTEPTHHQVAFIAGYKPKSGTWNRYLSSLRSAGLIEPKGALILTADGRSQASAPDQSPDAAVLRATVLDRIDGPLRKILSVLIEAYPDSLSHADCAAEAGYTPASGTWNRYLSGLRSLDMIEKKGPLKAQEWLFP